MTAENDLDDEMRGFLLDNHTEDRILAGVVAPEDAPPDLAHLAQPSGRPKAPAPKVSWRTRRRSWPLSSRPSTRIRPCARSRLQGDRCSSVCSAPRWLPCRRRLGVTAMSDTGGAANGLEGHGAVSIAPRIGDLAAAGEVDGGCLMSAATAHVARSLRGGRVVPSSAGTLKPPQRTNAVDPCSPRPSRRLSSATRRIGDPSHQSHPLRSISSP